MDGNIRGGTLLIRTVGDQSEVEVSGTRMDIIFNWTALTNQICQTIGPADCPRCHVAGADQRLPAQCPQVRNQNGGESGVWAVKMALKGNTLILVEVDNVQFAIIKSWNKMKWDKKSQSLYGTADIELLDKLTSIVHLPSTVEQRWRELHALQDAVDRERVNPEPVPFYKYPVKMPLYAHQVRGANMAMLTFGWMVPKGGVVHG